jgi:hydroxymethylbilane synthase
MVLPVSRFPTAPAQGALAIEVADGRADVIDLVRSVNHGPTERAVRRERAILQTYGGGCHEAIGVTALPRDYGDIVSLRGRPASGPPIAAWTIEREDRAAPQLDVSLVWPRPDERAVTARRALDVVIPADPRGLLVTRTEALPLDFAPAPDRIVWAAGTRTWEKLAARGIWVHGCSDGLGDDEEPRIDTLAGAQVRWLRLTHEGAGRLDDDEAVLATYVVERALPSDLGRRQAFFWTSGSLVLEALRRHPAVASGWHASGPGRTAATIRTALSDPGRASIWLDYDAWLQHVIR